jgi:hypothetical protein
MSLRERLKTKRPADVTITVGGERFTVLAKSRSERNEIYASIRARSQKVGGKIDGYEVEGRLLSLLVRDADTGQEVFGEDEWQEWDSVPAMITGALIAEVMRANGFDNEDVGREVKNSDTTAGSA